MPLDEALWLLIAAGEFYILVEMIYWTIRFRRDWKRSRAAVALGLFILVATFAARQAALVTGPLLIVLARTQVWLTAALILYLLSVIAVIVGMRILQYTFAVEEQNGQEDRSGDIRQPNQGPIPDRRPADRQR